ncbi:MAG: hypothetical protein IKG32_09215 [Clostridia bacterium]|nr:hypothetical protein [Clostridia bacterium]
MDIEWSKTIEEKVLVKDALATPFSIPTSQGNVTAGQTEPNRNIDSDDEKTKYTNQCSKNKSEDSSEFPITTTEQIFTLMGIYQNEWSHYDDVVWKHAFTYFGFILAVILFPFVTPWLKTPIIANMPYFLWVFPCVGIVLASVLLLVMLRYARRMRCCGTKYRDLIGKIPSDFQEERISNNTRLSITVAVAIIMFILLIAVAIFTMIHIPTWMEILKSITNC